MIDLSKLTTELVNKHNLASEKLTEIQLADAIRQAIEAEDFNTLVLPDGTQKVIYVPFLRYQELKARIFALEEQLRKTSQLDYGPPYYGSEVFKSSYPPTPTPDEVAARREAYIAMYGQP